MAKVLIVASLISLANGVEAIHKFAIRIPQILKRRDELDNSEKWNALISAPEFELEECVNLRSLYQHINVFNPSESQ
jgi:hypothetical protein